MKGGSRGLEGGLRRASRGLQGGLRRASNNALFVHGCWHSQMFQAIHNFRMDEPWSKKGPTNLQIGWAFSKPNCFESFEGKQHISGMASK